MKKHQQNSEYSHLMGVFQRIFFNTALGLILFTLSSLALSNTPQWPPPEPVQQRLNQALELLDDLKQLGPEYSGDLNDMAFDMEFDIDQAIAYVRDEVQFIPYRGVLRGVDGTAMTLAGNSWDQSLLLASLIKTIGGDAQVVLGTISQNDAKRLLLNAFVTSSDANTDPSTIDTDAILKRVAQYDQSLANLLAKDIEVFQHGEQKQALQNQTSAMTQELLNLLAKNDINLDSNESVDLLIQSLAEEYAWVRWRVGPVSEWQDLHPAFSKDDSPASEPKQYFVNEIPTEYQHRIAFELSIERTTNATVERVQVMQRFERPASELFKNQISLGMGPLANDNVDSGAIIVPLLNGQLAPGAQAVTELGLTANADDAASSAGQLFATVSSRMGDALGALASADGSEKNSAPRLTGILLNTQIILPGQESVNVERRLVDLREVNEEHSVQFPESAMFGLVMDIDIGAVNPAVTNQAVHVQNRKLLEALPIMLASARGAVPESEMQGSAAVKKLGPAKWLDYDLYSPDFLAPTTATKAVFRTGPMLASRRTIRPLIQTRENQLLTVSDILFNPVQVIHKEAENRIVSNKTDVIAQGVRETLLESELAATSRGWGERIPSQLIVNPDSLKALAAAENWPANAVDIAISDLEKGYLLGLVDTDQAHWWRVHPDTGETLGMSQYGGSELVFYVSLLGGAALSTIFFATSVEGCDATYPDNQEMADCCIVGNLGTTYATSIISGSAQNVFSNSFAAITGKISTALGFETITNFGVGVITADPIDWSCRAYLNQ